MNSTPKIVGYLIEPTPGKLLIQPADNQHPPSCIQDLAAHTTSVEMTDRIKHCYHLGLLISQFHSLEFLLRAVLLMSPNSPPTGLAFKEDIYDRPVNSKLLVSALTNYDSLNNLITKFNSEIAVLTGKPVDETIVKTRDALAHGRVSYKENSPMRIIKFSKVIKGSSGPEVTVEYNEVMTTDWFVDRIQQIASAIKIVSEAGQKLPTNKDVRISYHPFV